MGVTKVMSCIWVSEAQWKCGRSRPALIPLCPTQFFHNICPTQSFHNICPAQFFHTKWTFHKNCSVQCHNSHSGSSLQYQCNKTKLRISIQVTHFNTTHATSPLLNTNHLVVAYPHPKYFGDHWTGGLPYTGIICIACVCVLNEKRIWSETSWWPEGHPSQVWFACIRVIFRFEEEKNDPKYVGDQWTAEGCPTQVCPSVPPTHSRS